MILFLNGLTITETEYKCLLYVEENPEQWLLTTIAEKVKLRKDALIKEWIPRLFADSNITALPADKDTLIELIMARSDYRSRLQQNAEVVPPIQASLHNIKRFTTRRVTGKVVILFPTGITISAVDYASVLAYVEDMNDWVYGAILGHINRGKKKIQKQYTQMLFDDPAVITVPANENDLLALILQRPEYKTLPAQLEEARRAQR